MATEEQLKKAAALLVGGMIYQGNNEAKDSDWIGFEATEDERALIVAAAAGVIYLKLSGTVVERNRLRTITAMALEVQK